MFMKGFWLWLELVVDKLIPYLLVFIFAIIVLDIFYPASLEPYHLEIEIIDAAILCLFATDLVFKYISTRNTARFLRKYWVEIIAVLPFFVVARIVEEIVGIFAVSEDIARVQRVVHEGIVAEERIAADVGRSYRFARIVRPIARTPRFAKALRFYKKPGKHKQNI
jgi:hypothetical protein